MLCFIFGIVFKHFRTSDVSKCRQFFFFDLVNIGLFNRTFLMPFQFYLVMPIVEFYFKMHNKLKCNVICKLSVITCD
jgi:hypothetical protein